MGHNLQSALVAFEKFKTKWNSKYSYAIKSWEKNWDNLIPLFNYPPELRKIEHHQYYRRETAPRPFSKDQAALKSVFMAIDQIQSKAPIRDFGAIIIKFLLSFIIF